MTGRAVLNGASGVAIGYAGGKGNLNTMQQSAGRSIASGAKTDIATTMLGLGLEAMPQGSGPISFDVEVGWDVPPSGAITQSAHVHAFNTDLCVLRSLVTDIAAIAKNVGGNAPQWDGLSNRALYRQIQR
jgi:hypothetical protein